VIAGRNLERRRSGAIRLRLSRREQELLARLAAELGERLAVDVDEPDLVRLFPPAYADDPEEEREYRRLMRAELRGGKEEALRVFAATLGRDELTDQELEVWLRVLNDLRLVLGTRLDVGEETLAHRVDPRDPRAHERVLYGYLSWLQEQAVEAASSGLPHR
jgi:hypothetical protein